MQQRPRNVSDFLGSLSIPSANQIVTSVPLPNIVPFYRNSEMMLSFLLGRLAVSITVFADHGLKQKRDMFATNHYILKIKGWD